MELGPVWTGEATVSLHDAPTEELAALEPIEMIAGYWRQVGATFAGGSHGRMSLDGHALASGAT